MRRTKKALDRGPTHIVQIADVVTPAIQNALPAGTRVRSMRDSVPGMPMLKGYYLEEGTITPDPDNPENGTGDGLVATVLFDNDPAREWLETEYGTESLVWVWPRAELEVLEGPAAVSGGDNRKVLG